jgi:hypothetical protein
MRNWFCGCCVLSTMLIACVARAAQPAGNAVVPPAPAPRAAAQQTVPPSPLAQLLESQVRAAWAAFKKRDRAAYEKFLTNDFQAVEADGEGERTRLHVLGEVEHSMLSDYLLQMFQVQPLGPDYAFVTYENTMQFPRGAPLRFRRVFIGELWTRQSGHWQMMRYQETLVR